MGSTSSASEEFIELYNASSVPINFSSHNWRLEIASSSASSWASPLRTIPLYKVLQPGRSYVVASQYTSSGEQTQYLPDLAVASFSAGLTYTGGHIRLLYDVNQPNISNACVASSQVVDEFEWTAPKGTGTATQSLDLRQQYVSAKASGVAAGTSVQRQLDTITHAYTDTDNDATDFTGAVPTPGVVNTVVAVQAVTGGQAQVGLPTDTCSPNPPASGSDDEDEPDDSDTPATSGDTTNTTDSGQGDGSVEESGDTSDETAAPVANVNANLSPPIITELLPNPGSPQTDASDEFIELYNPNQSTFDLGGYQIQVGTSSTHTYTFPVGTQLPPGGYTAFFSAATGLSLGNSGGQAKLLDSGSAVLSASDIYGTAKDNQAWAVVDGKWQWTLSPTPNAANKLAAVASATTAKTTAAKKAATKTAAKPKATAKAKIKTTKAKADAVNTALVADTPTARSPVHPAVLAVIGVAAVLYGAYEYRQDVANYFRRLRENRAAGRKDRQAAERRGSD